MIRSLFLLSWKSQKKYKRNTKISIDYPVLEGHTKYRIHFVLSWVGNKLLHCWTVLDQLSFWKTKSRIYWLFQVSDKTKYGGIQDRYYKMRQNWWRSSLFPSPCHTYNHCIPFNWNDSFFKKKSSFYQGTNRRIQIIGTEKEAAQKACETYLSKKPAGTSASQIPVMLNNIKNKYNDVKVLSRLYDEK